MIKYACPSFARELAISAVDRLVTVILFDLIIPASANC